MDNTASCMIEVCDLHKHYKDVHVLRGISTTVAKGEVCAVIGPSGSGKSTFLRCLNRLEEASSGEIFINAQEITDPHLNLNKMRENIGIPPWWDESKPLTFSMTKTGGACARMIRRYSR